MKIKFKVNDVIQQLRQVSSVVNPKSTLPILENVIWRKVNNDLCFVASDSETWINIHNVPLTYSDINESFEICLNAKDTLSVLQNLSGEEIELDVDKEHNVVVGHYGRKGTFKLPMSEPDGFPQPKEISDDNKITVPTDVMTDCIQRVLFSVANDELRPVMNTIHFDFTEKNVIGVSSDGHKLARYTRMNVATDEMNGKSFNLPNKPATVLSRVIATYDTEYMLISCDDASAIKFNVGDCFITTRLIDARYPNYNSVIPQGNDKDFIVEKESILNILKRILPLGNASTECVVLHYNYGVAKEILLSTEDIDWSKSASEATECDTNVSEDVVIGFKGSELISVVQNVPSDKICIKIKDKMSAALFVPAETSPDYDYTSIMMPMIIN